MEPMFNHVAWVVEDQDGVIAFLERYLGCEAGPKQVIEGAWADELAQLENVRAIYCPVASKSTSTKIAVLKFVHPTTAENKKGSVLYLKGIRHIGFLVDDIDKTTADLKAGGYKFFSDVVMPPPEFHSKTVYFWGPENLVIQLSEAIPAAPQSVG